MPRLIFRHSWNWWFSVVKEKQQVMVSGSSIEMPIVYTADYFTDFDAIFLYGNIFAIEHQSDRNQFSMNKKNILLEIDTHDFQPGFASLKNENGRLFKHFHILFQKKGPSRQVQEWDSYIQSFLDLPEGFFLDHVWAVFCPVWPSVAGEWKTRIRVNGWPPKKLVNEIVNARYHLVWQTASASCEEWLRMEILVFKSRTSSGHQLESEPTLHLSLIRLVKNRVVQACGGFEKTILVDVPFQNIDALGMREKM